MTKRIPEPTKRPRERAYLIGVEIRDQEQMLSISDSLSELSLLASTAGLNVVGQTTQKLSKPNPKTFIGSGKVDEVKSLVLETQAEVILFDDELSPRHQRELEKIFGEDIRVIDRTALILDIFAQHASTSEGSLQVELAQYEYRLPRLTRAWTHLARQAGGGGGRSGAGGVGLRGPGETQLEVDRRDIHRRIDHLKTELEKVRAHRQRHRSRRKKSRIPVIALVGYTNAGKSTLLNQMAESNVYVADQLFATLDPTTRRVELPDNTPALFTDTVGFIQKLPTTLVAAFQATLEEIAEADLLIHVLDITHQNTRAQAEAVLQTLEEIEANHIPIVTALNKISEHRGEAYRAKNPQMLVPYLEDGELGIAQSMAILEYLEEAYPGMHLLPQAEPARSQVRAFCNMIASDIHPLNNLRVMNYIKKEFGADPTGDWYAHWIHEGFRAAEALASDGPYVFGDTVTLADALLVPQVYNARRFKVPLDDFPKLIAATNACNELTAFQDAAPEAQSDASA